MKTSRTLIHLVSDQTLQNILPILALMPDRVIQVMSKNNQRFSKSALNTQRTVELASRNGFSMPAEWPEPVAIGVDSPSIEQAQSVFRQLTEIHPGATVNYTGGTKNMSIGAWLAAKEVGAPAVYCDTPRQFVSGSTAEVSFPVALRDVAEKLNVEIILASQGLIKGEQWRREDFSKIEMEFGNLCFELIRQYGNEFRAYRHAVFSHAIGGGGKARAVDVERASTSPIPHPTNPAFVQYLDFAVQMRFLRENNGRWFYALNPKLSSGKDKIRQLGRLSQGLSGRAFEAYTASMLERSRVFTNYIANIKPAGSHPEEQGFGETDFLAYSPSSLALTLISCKASPPSLEHLESLLSRKAKFGGLFARTLLCVDHGVTDHREKQLRSHCESLQIDCAIGEEISEVMGVS